MVQEGLQAPDVPYREDNVKVCTAHGIYQRPSGT